MFRVATRPALRAPRIMLPSAMARRHKTSEPPNRRWDAEMTAEESHLEDVEMPAAPPRPPGDEFTSVLTQLQKMDPATASPQRVSKRPALDIASWNVYHMHCSSSSNNTITSLTDPNGVTKGLWSGGSVGFRKGNRESYEAGYQCAIRVFEKAHAICSADTNARLAVHFKGFGQGRDAFKSAILTMEGEKIRDKIVSVSDRTPLKIGGARAKKRPRK
ncbi:hypothetical protein DL96DRAFT_1679012 [Flagelloscypha sp. PMI_526]|nr:hypothetical protein DL96DRAFT_1679012 [Flagelloscypha sp. PMI_526]